MGGGDERQERVIDDRMEPMNLSDFEFKKQFRFSKATVVILEAFIEEDLSTPDERGSPLSPQQQVCLTLNFYGGAHFQRTSGLLWGVSQTCARTAVVRVTDALVSMKALFIHMPSKATMQDTADRMFNKYHLPRFCCAVDGVMMKFWEAPRGIPDAFQQQNL